MSAQVTIKSYKNKDLLKLKKLTEQCYWTFFTDNHYKKFVAIQNKDVIGVVVISITLGTANIDFIYVHKKFRSKGIGELLLRQTKRYAQIKNADGLGVNCGQENKGAIRFYKRNSFKQTGKVYNYFSNKNWQLFFWKKI